MLVRNEGAGGKRWEKLPFSKLTFALINEINVKSPNSPSLREFVSKLMLDVKNGDEDMQAEVKAEPISESEEEDGDERAAKKKKEGRGEPLPKEHSYRYKYKHKHSKEKHQAKAVDACRAPSPTRSEVSVAASRFP